jgi:hypothetical protein
VHNEVVVNRFTTSVTLAPLATASTDTSSSDAPSIAAGASGNDATTPAVVTPTTPAQFEAASLAFPGSDEGCATRPAIRSRLRLARPSPAGTE